ncbi:hypothetical protein EYF80_016699 [Liparis tanakae]|uniref:Uncharacterized protein n=1 Tax=Liparis tanakae TaxID=230148 RepID=A0A4Z2I4N7_9TELE|nr:hypothetical protein EYF80_016699 [Liparis tanakae]
MTVGAPLGVKIDPDEWCVGTRESCAPCRSDAASCFCMSISCCSSSEISSMLVRCRYWAEWSTGTSCRRGNRNSKGKSEWRASTGGRSVVVVEEVVVQLEEQEEKEEA